MRKMRKERFLAPFSLPVSISGTGTSRSHPIFLGEQAIHDPIFEYFPTLLPKMPFLRKTKCTSVMSSRRGRSDGLNYDVVEKSQVCSRTVLQAPEASDSHRQNLLLTLQRHAKHRTNTSTRH